MKKWLAILLAISMTAALLTGCGGKGSSGESGTSGSAAAEQQKAAETGLSEASSADNTYIILVQDANDSSPISSAMVQFCSDTQCMVSRTDAGGSAAFKADPGSYTAHVLKVPEGYEVPTEELSLTSENHTAVFELHRSGETAGD